MLRLSRIIAHAREMDKSEARSAHKRPGCFVKANRQKVKHEKQLDVLAESLDSETAHVKVLAHGFGQRTVRQEVCAMSYELSYACRAYTAHVRKMQRTYDQAALLAMQERRAELHNRVMDAMRNCGIVFRDRSEVEEMAFEMAGQ